MSDLHVQDLIGRRVLDQDGRPVGRIEEISAERRGQDLFITAYHIGAFALLERLTSSSLVRAILHSVGARAGSGFVVPWDRLDLTDAEKPRLTCHRSALQPLAGRDVPGAKTD